VAVRKRFVAELEVSRPKEIKLHFDLARGGVVVTVTSRDEEPVAVVARSTLAALFAALFEAAQRLQELQAEVDAEHLANDSDAQAALRRGADQITRGDALTVDEVRARLGRPRKER
jgi:hypothetical protein